MAPYFSALIWTVMGSLLHSLFSCSATSFLVNYAFQARKQSTCASLKLLKCFSSTFQSWKCRKCHRKSDPCASVPIFCLLNLEHWWPVKQWWFISLVKYFLDLFPQDAQTLWDIEFYKFGRCCTKWNILIWPFQFTISISENLFLKASAKATYHRWNGEVILVFAND